MTGAESISRDVRMMERALKLDPALLGINNRNLKTLEVDLATTERLAPQVPTEWKIVCESGIYTSSHISRMKEIGVNRFLVGESLMRESDVVSATRNLLNLPVQKGISIEGTT